MAIVNASDCSPKELYLLMTQTIVPRPVAWVLTQNQNQSLNLAPFSYFNGVSSDPPILMISAGKKRGGEKKDTWRNIEENGFFVVHIPGTNHLNGVIETAAPLEYGESEPENFKIKTVSTADWPLPRIESAKVAFLCRCHQIIEVGNKPQALILGEIQSLWLEDSIIEQKDGQILIDESGLDPLARLGKDLYASILVIDPARRTE